MKCLLIFQFLKKTFLLYIFIYGSVRLISHLLYLSNIFVVIVIIVVSVISDGREKGRSLTRIKTNLIAKGEKRCSNDCKPTSNIFVYLSFAFKIEIWILISPDYVRIRMSMKLNCWSRRWEIFDDFCRRAINKSICRSARSQIQWAFRHNWSFLCIRVEYNWNNVPWRGNSKANAKRTTRKCVKVRSDHDNSWMQGTK